MIIILLFFSKNVKHLALISLNRLKLGGWEDKPPRFNDFICFNNLKKKKIWFFNQNLSKKADLRSKQI